MKNVPNGIEVRDFLCNKSVWMNTEKNISFNVIKNLFKLTSNKNQPKYKIKQKKILPLSNSGLLYANVPVK